MTNEESTLSRMLKQRVYFSESIESLMSVDNFKNMLTSRLNFAYTARVALNDLSILHSYVIFSDQVHWKIAIWDVELNVCGKFWNTLLLVNSSMATTIFWNYCCFLQFHLRRVNTFMDFSYFLSSILSKINANQLVFIKQCILGGIVNFANKEKLVLTPIWER